jgi:hypothetical protein
VRALESEHDPRVGRRSKNRSLDWHELAGNRVG